MTKLTDKMKAFAQNYVLNGFNGAKAYRDAYDQDNNQVCASEAYKLLRDKRVIELIETIEGEYKILGQMEGLDRKTVVKLLADMASAVKKDKNGEIVPDYTARKDALSLWVKLTGDLKDKKELKINDKEESEIDVTKLTDKQRKDLEKELLSDL